MKMQNCTSHHQNQLGQAAALMIVLFAHFAAAADVSHHGDSAGNNVVSSKSNLGIDHDVTTAAVAGSTLTYSPFLPHQLYYYFMPAGGHSLMPYFYQVLKSTNMNIYHTGPFGTPRHY